MCAIGVISDNKHSFFILDVSLILRQYSRLVNGLLWFFTSWERVEGRNPLCILRYLLATPYPLLPTR